MLLSKALIVSFTWLQALPRRSQYLLEAQLLVPGLQLSLIQATSFRGEGISEDAATFCMSATSSAQGSDLADAFPKLPTGVLISGLPAAVMSSLQASAHTHFFPELSWLVGGRMACTEKEFRS